MVDTGERDCSRLCGSDQAVRSDPARQRGPLGITSEVR